MEDQIVLKVTIEKAIEKLTEPRKKIAYLLIFERYSPRDIINDLNLSRSNVYYHIKEIKKYLKKELL